MESYAIKDIKCNIIICTIFLLWPFLGFIVFLFLSRYISNKSFLFVLFYGYIGYSFLLNDPFLDSYRYVEQFKHISQGGTYSLIDNLKLGILDIYSVLTMQMVSLITDNVSFLFAIWGSIFGYFVGDTFFVLTNTETNKRVPFLCAVVFVVMFLLNSPININGVRFWTAIWVAIAGFLEFEIKNRKRGLVFIMMTPFIHTSFLLFIIIYLVYRILKKKTTSSTLVVIFVITYIISLLLSASSISGFLSGFIAASNHFSAYLDYSYINEREALAATKSMLNIIMTSLPMFFMILYILFGIKSKTVHKDSIQDKILKFLLIFMIFINILELIPSISRFNILGYLLFLSLIYVRQMYYSHNANIILAFIIIFCFAGEIYVSNGFLSKVLDYNVLLPSFL